MWNNDPSLIDIIYEAGAMPELWPAALQAISEACGAQAGLLTTLDPDRSRWIGSPRAQEIMPLFIAGNWPSHDPRIPAILSAPIYSGFHAATDLIEEKKFCELPICTEFLRPHGLEAGVATLIQSMGKQKILLTFEGFESSRLSQAVAKQLDWLRPHLARATALSSRLELERVRAAVVALELIDVPAAMVDFSGRLQSGNALFAQIIGRHVFDSRTRLSFSNVRTDDQYARAIGLISNGVGGQTVILRRLEESPVAMHIVPVRGSARDVFQQSAAIILLADGQSKSTMPPTLLQSLFDLSPAEARVISMLCDGDQPKEIARKCNLSGETIRSHLKSAFTKTNTRKQSELIALLSRYTPSKPVVKP